MIGRWAAGGVRRATAGFHLSSPARSHSLDSNNEHLSRIQRVLLSLQSTSSRVLREDQAVVKRAIHPGIIDEIWHPRFVLDRSTTRNEAQPEEPRRVAAILNPILCNNPTQPSRATRSNVCYNPTAQSTRLSTTRCVLKLKSILWAVVSIS